MIVFENKSNDTLTIITNKHDLFEFIETRVRKSEKDTFVSKFNFPEYLNKDSIWASTNAIYNSNKHIKNLSDLRRMLKDSVYVRAEDNLRYYYIKYNPDFGKLIQSDTAVVIPGKSQELEYLYMKEIKNVDIPSMPFNEVVIFKGSKNHQIIIKDEALKKCFSYSIKYMDNYRCHINKYIIY